MASEKFEISNVLIKHTAQKSWFCFIESLPAHDIWMSKGNIIHCICKAKAPQSLQYYTNAFEMICRKVTITYVMAKLNMEIPKQFALLLQYFNTKLSLFGCRMSLNLRRRVRKDSFFPDTIRDRNAVPASIVSSAESSEDPVARFTSLVRSSD